MNVTGEDMMTPVANIYLWNFWQLRFVINDHFFEALAAFDGQGSVAKQIGRVERNHHSRLGEV